MIAIINIEPKMPGKKSKYKVLINDTEIYEQALDSLDYKTCLNIINENSKDLCLKEIAILKKDEQICLEIDDPNIKNNCKDNIKIEKSIIDSDIKACQEIETKSLQKLCIEKIIVLDNVDCSIIADSSLQTICYNKFYYHKARADKDVDICFKIF